MPALKKKPLMLLLYLLAVLNAQSQQSTMDITDSLVNHQKQFIIRFDVATGNIYVPIKKFVKIARDEKDKYRLLGFIDEKDSIGDDKRRIIKTVQQYDDKGNPQKIDTFYAKKLYKSAIGVKYIKAGRFFRPKVGSFIRMIFENVPKGMDVNVSAEFLDKNLENSSTFQGYLNTFGKGLDTGVSREARRAIEIKEHTKTAAEKEIESKSNELKAAYDNLDKQSAGLNTSVNTIENFLNDIPQSKKDKDKGTAHVLAAVSHLADSISNNTNLIRGILVNSDTNTSFKATLNKIDNFCNEIKEKSTFNGKAVEKLKGEMEKLDSQVKNIVQAKSKIDELSKSLNNYKISMDSIIKKTDTLIAAIYDSIYSRRTIYIQPIQVANNDMTILRVTYRKDDRAQNDINREIMLKNKYGFKLDFSTGFIGTGLKDDNYRLEPGLNDSAKIMEDPKGNFAVGFALLAHAYVRTGERVNVALNTGLMLNGSNQTINYLAGLSLPLGLEQRFIISGGVSFGKVKRLTTGYETGNTYPATKLSIAAGVPYTEKWKNSWYIGVSYNLSSLTASSRKVVIAR